jgi:hypothetical protein
VLTLDPGPVGDVVATVYKDTGGIALYVEPLPPPLNCLGPVGFLFYRSVMRLLILLILIMAGLAYFQSQRNHCYYGSGRRQVQMDMR